MMSKKGKGKRSSTAPAHALSDSDVSEVESVGSVAASLSSLSSSADSDSGIAETSSKNTTINQDDAAKSTESATTVATTPASGSKATAATPKNNKNKRVSFSATPKRGSQSFCVPDHFKEAEYNPGLDEGSELFLIRVPKGFNINKLEGKRFSKNEKKNVGEESGPGDLKTVFEMTPYKNEDIGIQPLIKKEGKICLGPKFEGLMTVTKSYEVSESCNQPPPPVAWHGRVPMPQGLKARFTPFGAESPSSSVNKPAEVVEENNNWKKKRKISNSPPPSSKKHKTVHLNGDVSHLDTSHEKHKKHKSKYKESQLDIKPDPDADFVTPHKKHKKAKSKDSQDIILNIKQEPGSSSKKKKKHEIMALESHQQIIASQSVDLNGSLDTHTGKKKKKKKDKDRDRNRSLPY